MADLVETEAPAQIGVREFRGNMTSYLRRARQGASFMITAHGEVLAQLLPPAPAMRPPRQPGALRGQIRIGPDFDTLPEDILAAMEGEED